jgi:Flp pilus assembly protein protease CpaA
LRALQARRRGLGALLDALDAHAQTMLLAFMLNAVFYGFLTIGILTKTDVPATSKGKPRSRFTSPPIAVSSPYGIAPEVW